MEDDELKKGATRGALNGNNSDCLVADSSVKRVLVKYATIRERLGIQYLVTIIRPRSDDAPISQLPVSLVVPASADYSCHLLPSIGCFDNGLSCHKWSFIYPMKSLSELSDCQIMLPDRR